MEMLFGISTVLCLVLIVGLIVFLIKSRPGVEAPTEEIVSRFDDFSQRLATEHGVVSEKFAQLDRKLEVVQTTFDKRDGAIDEQMSRIGREVTGIVSLFNNDRTRGSWGELSLERIFEVAGLVEGRDYINQFDGGDGRPDVVILLPGDQRMVIDSKFPVARYLDAMAEDDPEKRAQLLVAHGKELEAVGKSLVKKHYAGHATAGYVIVYVPSQAVYEAALEFHPEVIDRLLSSSVVVTGPSGLFGMIKTTATLLAQHRAVDDAREIVDQVRELRTRLGTFAGHLLKVGGGLKSASNAYNQAIGSWNGRLTPSVNRIAEMSGSEELDAFESLPDTLITQPSHIREAV